MAKLLIGVLQGRLNEVLIDDFIAIKKEEEESEVPVKSAINLFFSISTNQVISKREDLIKAAESFCDENKRVDREEFIKEIIKHANTSEIN